MVPVLKNLGSINKRSLSKTLSTAARLNSLRPNTTGTSPSIKRKPRRDKKKNKPLEIDYVGVTGSSHRHAANNILTSRAFEMNPSKESLLSARDDGEYRNYHRSYEDFIRMGGECTQMLRHNSVDNTKKTIQEGTLHFNRAMAYSVVGNLDKAIKDYSTSIEICQSHGVNCGRAYFNRGMVYHTLGDVDKALEDVNRAVKSDTSVIEYYEYRSQLLRLKNQYIESIVDVRKCRDLKEKKKGGRREKKNEGAAKSLRRMSSTANFDHGALLNSNSRGSIRERIAATGDDRMPRHSMLLAGGALNLTGSASAGQTLDTDGIRGILEKPGHERTTLEARKIANTIKEFKFFQMLADDMEALVHLCKKMTVHEIQKGEYLFRKGDLGDVFYVLYEGAIAITIFTPNVVKGAPDVEKLLKLLHKGDTFGETALKTAGGRRGANAKAETKSLLLIIQCEDFLSIEEEHEVFINEQKMKMVQRCPAFMEFSHSQLENIVSKMDVKRYDAQTVITSRGDVAPDLCLIRKGMVKVLKSTPLNLCEVGEKEKEDDESAKLSKVGVVDEIPGIWVIQRNWREVMEPKNSSMTTMDQVGRLLGAKRRGCIATETNSHDFTVGVLGSGEFFGELAVLEAAEASPVTVIAVTNVEIYCLSHNDVLSLKLHVNKPLKLCLEESMVMHNPPAHKVAHYFRSKIKWEAKKDRILGSCMSEKWVKLRQEVTNKKDIEAGKARLMAKKEALREAEEHLGENDRMTSRNLLENLTKKDKTLSKVMGGGKFRGKDPRAMFRQQNKHNFSNKKFGI
ncbi:hypothetical protein TL16_g00812 [Triparma laevis f. inornata]|uniref:Cyclic nucleotide-binding domain-containing protein n=1 Tax=Triparma laevis f. inornata TaxID=1714386 RepID=A0A9W7DQG6_9STRA|nr:hypothetical protein TL16_g00812 [Triparma laevis f. inornata]